MPEDMTPSRVFLLLFAIAEAACSYDLKEVPLEPSDRHAAASSGAADADGNGDADTDADADAGVADRDR